MKRFAISACAALLALATVVAGTALAKQPPRVSAKKVNICHFTGKKYVAITVGKSAMQVHMQHHQDLINSASVPQGTTRAKMAAARSFCSALTVLSPTRGGTPSSASLTSVTAGLTGSINTRARLGQGQLCLKLTVNSTTTPITVSGITILNGATTLATLNLSTLGSLTSATSPLNVSGCVSLDRSLVKQILQTSGLTVQVATSSPAGATLTGAIA